MTTDAPITLEELLKQHDWHLVTYRVRYGGPGMGVLIGFDIDTLAMMADDMTGGDGDWWRASRLPDSVPWFPAGSGDTFQEALDQALARVNTLTREQWFEHAVYEVSSMSTKYAEMRKIYDETKWPSLNPTPWLDVEADEEECATEPVVDEVPPAEVPREVQPRVVFNVINSDEFIRQLIDRSRV